MFCLPTLKTRKTKKKHFKMTTLFTQFPTGKGIHIEHGARWFFEKCRFKSNCTINQSMCQGCNKRKMFFVHRLKKSTFTYPFREKTTKYKKKKLLHKTKLDLSRTQRNRKPLFPRPSRLYHCSTDWWKVFSIAFYRCCFFLSKIELRTCFYTYLGIRIPLLVCFFFFHNFLQSRRWIITS